MSKPEDGPDAEREAAAAALASLRAAVRQRTAERAATIGEGDDLGLQVGELRQREFVQEPMPVSPRPGIGRLIVFLRKAVYHLFGKWHVRATLRQQNEFNQTAAALLEAVVERERETRREIARLAARVAELEAGRAPAGEPTRAGGPRPGDDG